MSSRSQRANKASKVKGKPTHFTDSDSDMLSSPPTSPESSSGRSVAIEKAPTLRQSRTEMVTIEVIDAEGTKKPFVLHKHFACYYSPFFNAAFNGRFSEGTTQFMDLFTPSWESFGIFADWLYTQKVADAEGEMPSSKNLIDLWILADSLLVPKLQNQAMEALAEELTKGDVLSVSLFTHIYENTMEASPLRLVVVDFCVSGLRKFRFEDHLPLEMLVDVINANADLPSRKPTKITRDKVKKYFVSEEVPERR